MSELHPTFWRTCRVLANEKRLQLIWLLFEMGEANVTALGERVGLREPVASDYLRAINARGLIRAERRSNYVFYKPEANPEVEHAAALLEALRDCHSADAEVSDVMRCLTGFTHERRITIVRALSEKGRGVLNLAIATQISPQALGRHLRKLEARGYVEWRDDLVHLARPPAAFARVLLDIALD